MATLTADQLDYLTLYEIATGLFSPYLQSGNVPLTPAEFHRDKRNYAVTLAAINAFLKYDFGFIPSTPNKFMTPPGYEDLANEFAGLCKHAYENNKNLNSGNIGAYIKERMKKNWMIRVAVGQAYGPCLVNPQIPFQEVFVKPGQ